MQLLRCSAACQPETQHTASCPALRGWGRAALTLFRAHVLPDVDSCALLKVAVLRPQSITMGIALPDWLLDAKSRSAPMVLAGLVFGGILLPLGFAACYLLSANKYVGPNGIMEETYDLFARCAACTVCDELLPHCLHRNAVLSSTKMSSPTVDYCCVRFLSYAH